MMTAYDTYLVLAGLDPQCARYVAAYKDAAAEKSAAPTHKSASGKGASADTLFDAILHGLEKQAGEQA